MNFVLNSVGLDNLNQTSICAEGNIQLKRVIRAFQEVKTFFRDASSGSSLIDVLPDHLKEARLISD